MLFVFVWLTSLSVTISRSSCAAANDIICLLCRQYLTCRYCGLQHPHEQKTFGTACTWELLQKSKGNIQSPIHRRDHHGQQIQGKWIELLRDQGRESQAIMHYPLSSSRWAAVNEACQRMCRPGRHGGKPVARWWVLRKGSCCGASKVSRDDPPIPHLDAGHRDAGGWVGRWPQIQVHRSQLERGLDWKKGLCRCN